MKFAVASPPTNTSVEPEYAAMQPRGVSNHFSRIAIPDTKVTDDASFMVMLQSIRDATFDAVDVSMSMEPGCFIMGMSAETFWDGAEGADAVRAYISSPEYRAGAVLREGAAEVDMRLLIDPV